MWVNDLLFQHVQIFIIILFQLSFKFMSYMTLPLDETFYTAIGWAHNIDYIGYFVAPKCSVAGAPSATNSTDRCINIFHIHLFHKHIIDHLSIITSAVLSSWPVSPYRGALLFLYLLFFIFLAVSCCISLLFLCFK